MRQAKVDCGTLSDRALKTSVNGLRPKARMGGLRVVGDARQRSRSRMTARGQARNRFESGVGDGMARQFTKKKLVK